ncbi:MAG TPA: IS630 family transposase [Patescibacteria group bacterium]|nr:IS630 family transposase [Patescibacteria group bacterium]
MRKKLKQKQIKELEKLVEDSARKSPEVRRAQAVLLLNEGAPVTTINRITRLSRTRMFVIYASYIEIGVEAFRDKRQGKPKEILTKKQRDEIVATVGKKTPKQLGFGNEFWTTGVLGAWIEQKYDVKYKSKTSLYLVFRQASFSYHKPERRYHERNESEILTWRKANKKKIQRHFNDPNTVLLAADEMILTTKTTTQKVWLPQGETVRVEVANSSIERRQIYGFLNVKTGVEHAFKTLKQNMHTTKDVLGEVRKIYQKQKIVLLWDNAGWHRGSVVQEYIKEDGNIQTIHFPKYAPEENPQEHVWKRGRSEVTHNRFIDDIDAATDDLITFLNTNRFPYSLFGMSPVS